jgi:hypothetical protein
VCKDYLASPEVLTVLLRRFLMKRMPMRSFLLVVALPFVAVGAAPDAGVTKDAEISAILSRMDSTRILETATTLQNFRTRQSCSASTRASSRTTPVWAPASLRARHQHQIR